MHKNICQELKGIVDFVKERIRAEYHRLPYNNLPRTPVKYLVSESSRKLTFFPNKRGISKYYSPRMILHQENLDYKSIAITHLENIFSLTMRMIGNKNLIVFTSDPLQATKVGMNFYSYQLVERSSEQNVCQYQSHLRLSNRFMLWQDLAICHMV